MVQAGGKCKLDEGGEANESPSFNSGKRGWEDQLDEALATVKGGVVAVREKSRWVREEQPANTQEPVVVRDAGNVRELREEQSEKAQSPMVVRDAGNVREVRDEQSRKAPSLMLVSVAGSVISVSRVHPRNACRPMVVMPGVSTHRERELHL